MIDVYSCPAAFLAVVDEHEAAAVATGVTPVWKMPTTFCGGEPAGGDGGG